MLKAKKRLRSNSKLKKSGIVSFDLPACSTCPFADQCKNGCYARKAEKMYPNVKAFRAENLALSKSDTFIDHMCQELSTTKTKIIRLHASGDFYSKQYLLKWIKIASLNPEKRFYAYTKSVVWGRSVKLPKNMKLIFSHGGKQDHLITASCNQCHVINPEQLPYMLELGYQYGNDSDLIAVKNRKIALVYHGVMGKIDRNVFSTMRL